MYIEVPAPDCERKHEWNLNHYSIMGSNQIIALLQRTGFDVNAFNGLDFDLSIPDQNGNNKSVKERFYCILVTKQRPLDIK
jgi:hypothetical protein